MDTIEQKISKRIDLISKAWARVVSFGEFANRFLGHYKKTERFYYQSVNGSGQITIEVCNPDKWGNKFDLCQTVINGAELAEILKNDKQLSSRLFSQYSTLLREQHFDLQQKLDKEKSSAIQKIQSMN